MSDRRCGYCREYGHMASKCKILSGQKEAILNHVAGERYALHNLLLENGVGLGTILRQTHYDGTVKEYVITSLLPLVQDRMDVLSEYRIHKYRKSVNVTLRSWTGINHSEHNLPEDYIRTQHMDRIFVPARSLTDMSSQDFCLLYVSRLEKKPDWAHGRNMHLWGGSPAEILCHSSDTDVTQKDCIEKGIRFHDRLCTRKGESPYIVPRFRTT